jgi:hypothetical protein
MEDYKFLFPIVDTVCKELDVRPSQEYFDGIRMNLLRRAKRITPVSTYALGLDLLRPLGKELEGRLRDTPTAATFGYHAGRGTYYLAGGGEGYDNKVGLLGAILNINIKFFNYFFDRFEAKRNALISLLNFFLKNGSCSVSLKDLYLFSLDPVLSFCHGTFDRYLSGCSSLLHLSKRYDVYEKLFTLYRSGYEESIKFSFRKLEEQYPRDEFVLTSKGANFLYIMFLTALLAPDTKRSLLKNIKIAEALKEIGKIVVIFDDVIDLSEDLKEKKVWNYVSLKAWEKGIDVKNQASEVMKRMLKSGLLIDIAEENASMLSKCLEIIKLECGEERATCFREAVLNIVLLPLAGSIYRWRGMR